MFRLLGRQWVLYPLVCGVTGVAISVGPLAFASDDDADQSTTLRVSAQIIELVTEPSNNGMGSEQVRFWITGPTPQKISVEILDIVSDRTGAISLLPAGSTGHSLAGIVTILPPPTEYVPNGSIQFFSFDVHAKNAQSGVYFGGIRISMSPDDAVIDQATFDTISAVFLPIIVAPEGVTGVLPVVADSPVTLAPIQVRGPSHVNFFEQLLPDIPGVINRGPVTFYTELTNPSTNPFFLSTSWEMASGEDVLLAVETERRLVLPGQETSDELSTARSIEGSSRPVDVLPSFGFVRVQIDGEAYLAQTLLGSQEATATYLVLRWKEPFAITIALGLVVVLLWRARKQEESRKTASV